MTNGIIEHMQAEIDELKEKVERLEGAEVKRELTGFQRIAKLTKTPQQRRDEIVERAKKDVATGALYNHDVCFADFVINREKRTVVALMKSAYPNPIVYLKGIAKCAPNDCFNSHIGKAIALRRALGLEVPAEYLNAPQPTEVRVGDVVGYPFDEDDACTEKVISIEGPRIYYADGGWDFVRELFSYDPSGPLFNLRIIDDSREEVDG